MNNVILNAPCHFGLEAVLKKEITDLGYDVCRVEDGRVSFTGDKEAICLANIHLRTAERVLIEVARFTAVTFDELFEATKSIEWEQFIPKDGRFYVAKAASVKSKLFSPSDIQSIMKKAMVERLKGVYGISWFEETGDTYPVRVFINKDEVSVMLDTTGDSLHKRGYRKLSSKAPIAENLAAGLIMLTPWKPGRILADPFCGSGTFVIEAAMMAANMAPGMNRDYLSMTWKNIFPKGYWYPYFDEAREDVNENIECDLSGFDIDPDMIKTAWANARLAGVDKLVNFNERSVNQFKSDKEYGFIITNPPYGGRLEDENTLPPIYESLGDVYNKLRTWSMYVVSSYDKTEKYIGKKAAKNRKIYNGMIKTYFYQYPGPKPERGEV